MPTTPTKAQQQPPSLATAAFFALDQQQWSAQPPGRKEEPASSVFEIDTQEKSMEYQIAHGSTCSARLCMLECRSVSEGRADRSRSDGITNSFNLYVDILM